MERNLIQTVACYSGIGLCAALAGCQSADNNDYYQPTSRYGSEVQQVPQAYPTVPSGSGYSIPSPTPSHSRPTLIAPPGQSSGPPMAPPAVPGVAPYGTSGGPTPVPAPTSWIPGPQNNMVFVGYPRPNFVSLHNGLIEPTQNGLRIQQVNGKKDGISWMPIRRGVNQGLNRNSEGAIQQSELGFPAPGSVSITQNRQLPASGQALDQPVFVPSPTMRSQFSPQTPWTVNNNPVSISAVVLPQQAVPAQPVLEQHVERMVPRPILVSPSADETFEAWPNKLSEDELEKKLDQHVTKSQSFSLDELPQIQPEIRHRLSSSAYVTERPVPVPAATRVGTAEEDRTVSGPLLLR